MTSQELFKQLKLRAVNHLKHRLEENGGKIKGKGRKVVLRYEGNECERGMFFLDGLSLTNTGDVTFRFHDESRQEWEDDLSGCSLDEMESIINAI